MTGSSKNRNACRCTGYISIVDAVNGCSQGAAGRMSDSALEYKPPADGKVYGTRIPRPTSVAKVCGLWDFGDDMGRSASRRDTPVPLSCAEVAHANIKGIDTSGAEKMPGVFKIVTHKDVKGKNRITGLITFPTNKGDGWDRPILSDEKIFQYGDAVAIVMRRHQENMPKPPRRMSSSTWKCCPTT